MITNFFVVMTTLLSIFFALTWTTKNWLNVFFRFYFVILSILGVLIWLGRMGILTYSVQVNYL